MKMNLIPSIPLRNPLRGAGGLILMLSLLLSPASRAAQASAAGGADELPAAAPAGSRPAVAPPPPPPPPPADLPKVARPAAGSTGEEIEESVKADDSGDLTAELDIKAERAFSRARDALKAAGSKLQFHFDSGLERLDREIGGINLKRSSGSAALVVPGKSIDPQRLAEAEEDLNIMSRLLAKAIQHPIGEEAERAMGIKLRANDRPRSVRHLHLEGQGALFVFRVGFPLSPPDSGAKDSSRPNRKASAWEEARSELYGRGEPERSRDVVILGDDEPLEDYDEARVEGLKRELLTTLKQASNMRHLGAQDFVTVLVQGPDANRSRAITRALDGPMPPPDASRGPRKGQERYERGGKSTEGGGGYGPKTVEKVVGYVNVMSDGGGARTSSLLVRAKKEDIDAYAAGSIDAAEFGKRASVLTYTTGGPMPEGTKKRASF